MDALEALELRFTNSDGEAATQISESTHEIPEVDHGKAVSTTDRDDRANEETSDSLKFAALQTVVKSVAKANTNTAYLNLESDSLKLATVKLIDPLKRCMVTPDNPRTCLIEEDRSTRDGELSKLLEYHLELVELRDFLPFNAMLLVAHGTTTLFQSINTDGLTFSALPYEVKGLKMITHQQRSALSGPQRAARSRFSKVAIQDCSTESLKNRGLKQLRFHKYSSKHDWQCFVDVNDSKYLSMFGDSEHSFFERIMAATIELFEHGRTLHQSRPLRSDQIKQYEAIARAKYVQQVERKRIALEGWGQYLTHMDAQTRPVLRTRPSDSDISRALQEECAGSKQEQQLAVEADADVSRGIPNGILDVESGNEASDEEEADSEKADDSRGKGKALGVDGRDSVHGRDIKINTTSARARKKGKGKGPKKGKGLHRGRNRLALSPRPGEKSTDEDDVVPPKKSGSSAFSKQHSPVNTAKGPDLVLYPPYGHISRFSSSNTNITDNTASVAAEEVEMDGLNGRVSRMALEGDRERAHKDRSQSKGSTGDDHDEGWQTVAHGKTRKSNDKNVAPPTPSPRRGAPAATNRARPTHDGRRAPDFITPESSSSSYPAFTAVVAPTLNAEEFPSLPTPNQSEEALKKVMAKRKKKKDKLKKKRSALQSESSQSSGDLPGYSSVETLTVTSSSGSQLLADLVQQGTQESQGYGTDGAANVTDEDITPNASMINLAAAGTSQPSSTSAPPQASASQPGSLPVPTSARANQPASSSATPTALAGQTGSTPAPLSAGTRQSHHESAPPPPTTPAAGLVHKFGAMEGPTRIVCRMPGCDNTTSPWDGSTVICPSCGPYSSIRYCCIDHLLRDTTDHWGVDCMKYTCHHLCDASTIHPRQVQCPPAIPNLCGWNTPERHRQAVYHAHSFKKNGFAEVEGDYFIFTDAEEWIQAGSPDRQSWGLRRARGAVLVVVSFPDERSPSSLKDRFNRLLNIALFTGACNARLLDYLFLMIRENLLSKGEWGDTILDSVVYQFQWEFCYQVPESIINNLRHACPHQWIGTPIDECHNVICNREMLQPGTRHPLGPRIPLQEKADELERRYWILRVARVYHPNVQDPAQRMRGVGCSFVAPGNRRVFRRGREWDGFPTGTMEVEGAIWVPNAVGPPYLQVANLMTLTV